MRCPFCDHEDSRVIDSRPSPDAREIKRRRECPHCGRRFNTYERVEVAMPLVIKKNGNREPYERAKILGGLRSACEKRPISAEDMERIVNAIELKLSESGEKEVPSSRIGEEVMGELSALDHVAYVRFASVYREFQELDDYIQAVKDLSRRRRTARRPGRGVSDQGPKDDPVS